jgi:hypothetical protein
MVINIFTTFTKDVGVYTVRIAAGAYNSELDKIYDLRVYNSFTLTITKDAPPVQVS